MDSLRDTAESPRPMGGDVVQGPNDRLRTCRCGIRLPAGESVWRVMGIATSLGPLVRDSAYCSPECLHAFLLESLEMFDAIDRASAAQLVSDLDATYEELRRVLAGVKRYSRVPLPR